MHRHTACLLALIGAAPVAAQEVSFDGLWRTNPATDCTYVEGEGGVLRIEDDVLYGAENTCDMTSPVNVRDMDAVLYDMQCSAEGDEFTERAMFLAAADGGLLLVWNGFAFKYEACGGDAVEGAVTTSDQIGITD